MQKKIYSIILLLIIFTSKSFAQTDPLRQKLDSIFQYVDKTQIPTGYLKEYGSEFLPVHWFNGILTDSNTVNDPDIFRTAYCDMITAKLPQQVINPEARMTIFTTLPPLPQVNDQLDSVAINGPSPIAILYTRYASLSETALDDNLFTVTNQQIYDVPNRLASPYNINNLFVAVPVITEFTNTVSLRLDTSFFYKNMNVLITNAYVDFIDGQGYQTLSSIPTQKTYTDSTGRKPLVFKITTSDGNTLYCNSSVIVTLSNTASRYEDTDPLMATIPVRVVAADGIGGGDFMQIRYAKDNPTRLQPQQHLRKPIIYVEGYDPSDLERIDPNNKGNNIYSLIRDNPNTDKKGEWVSLITQGYDFMYYLDDVAAYDLVYVNYNTFRSFEDNSKMLQRVIEWVNADKALGSSTAKNVVLGVSAGGVLSRYTLARMTKYIGVNSTDTRLLLTMDSPHQGSNVPLSLQHFLYDLGEQQVLGQKLKDNDKALKKFIYLNSQIATVQLLKARVVDATGTVLFNTFLNGPNSPYQQMVRFDAANNPGNVVAPYKFLAVAQGSQCGVPVTTPGITFASQDAPFATFRFWFPPTPWTPFIHVASKWWLKCEMKALPNAGTANIEYFKFERRIKLWGIGFGWKTMNEYNRSNPPGFTTWDAAPGSTQSIEGRAGGGLSTGLVRQDIWKNWNGFPFIKLKAGPSLNINQDLFAFVSPTSSLDAPIGTDPYTVFNFAATGNANTSAEKYIAQSREPGSTLYNQEHTNYTARNALWIFNEMENLTQPVTCQDYCTTNEIIGPTEFCGSSSFSLNFPTGSTINWSISPNPNSIVTSTANGNTLFLTQRAVSDPLLGNSGEVTITANYTSSCGNGPVSKTVFVGVRTPEIAMTGLCGGGFEAMAIPNSYGQNYNWYADGVLQAHHGYKIRVLNFTSPYPIIGLQIVSQSCGMSQVRYENAYCQTKSPLARFTVSPVPSKNNITVTGIDGFSFSSIMIVDKIGNVKKLLKFPGNTKSANINISDLPNDVYYIKVLNGKEWVGKSMSIQ